MLLDHSGFKIEINSNRNYVNAWRLNSALNDN